MALVVYSFKCLFRTNVYANTSARSLLMVHNSYNTGYIAVPPCLWGSVKDGLEAPPLMSNMTIKVIAVTNNTYVEITLNRYFAQAP